MSNIKLAVAISSWTGKDSSHLSLKRGDVIKVFEQFPTGWWKGELHDDPNSSGLFPSKQVELLHSPQESPGLEAPPPLTLYSVEAIANYDGKNEKELSFVVGTVMQVTEETNAGWLYCQDPKSKKIGLVPSTYIKKVDTKSTEPIQISQVQDAVAIYDFDGEKEPELSFKVGDKMKILAKLSMGWLKADLNGKIGHVPEEFVQIVKNEPSNQTSTPPPAGTAVSTVPKSSLPAVDEKKPTVIQIPNPNPRRNTVSFGSANKAMIASLSNSVPKSKQVKALFDFNGNGTTELVFTKGTEFTVIETLEKGWCRGVLKQIIENKKKKIV